MTPSFSSAEMRYLGLFFFPYPNYGYSGAASYANTYGSGLSRPTLKLSTVAPQLRVPSLKGD